ncbi:MAG TPA: ATP-binding protein [Bacilli bacterium]|jgi:anti-sigma regulatory factor (Ser/Thr protein kinase)|nr:anti-sigma regulatory factor [Acholeplasmataceae bacterium]HNZ77456.1 ATP-binding protein [Bacilli bacterium]HOD61662.1 ATP-binding protein [Bacilli bacterium]HOH61661.1 ATP-binding protein [Bacilli bacterium]HPB48865.1 ATP-binding protein [Bacilli bacterium]
MIYTFEILPMNLEQAGYISSFIKKLLVDNKISKMVIRRVSIATYEAEINVVIHSYGGKCVVDYNEKQLKIVFSDTGPGIKNIESAMTEGFSTASTYARENGFGAGMGLPNIRNSCDEFDIQSSDKGTIVTIIFNL